MKVYRNLAEVTRKETIGRRFSLTGLGILLIGMLASFVPNWYPPGTVPTSAWGAFLQQYWVLASFIALPAGFLCATVGSYYINRFARRRWPGNRIPARPDEVIERAMKGFDDKFTYFAHALPSHYVITGPCGVLVLLARNDRGRITVNGERWREPFSMWRLLTLFAREGVGNPPMELDDHVNKLRALLQKAPVSSGEGDGVKNLAEVPVDGAVVFLNDLTQLELTAPTVTVLRTDQVKDYVRRKAKEVKLSTSMTKAVTNYLRENSKYQEESTSG